MKTIIEQYGISVLASIVVMGILVILFNIQDANGNIGIFQVIGAQSDINNDLYENMTDTKAVIDENSAVVAPVMTYNSKKCIASNEVVLGDYINVVIANKDKYKLSNTNCKDLFTYDILSIVASDGTSYTGEFSKQNGKITFPQGGMYSVTIRCYDLINGKNTTSTIIIPVDNQKEEP